MWEELPIEEKDEYKKMILAFASLTEMFAQKAENNEETIELSPIINSKYQETVFQRVFHASAEDIGNTSYDAAINYNHKKYLIGIKTFGINSGSQKIAQFKANHNEWSDVINKMRENGTDEDGNVRSKEEINRLNRELYQELAHKISELRNARIRSSISNLQGFTVSLDKDDVQSVYHVLMPSKKGEAPQIFVGETSYDQINIEKIDVRGCTGAKTPTNFEFFDGNHVYRYTSADSQLLMNFNNTDIVKDKWDVVYAEDAYSLFAGLAEQIYGEKKAEIVESYSWRIIGRRGKVERYSGFNSFFGVGSKITKADREKRLQKIKNKYTDVPDIREDVFEDVLKGITKYLLEESSREEEKREKEALRDRIVKRLNDTKNQEFKDEIMKLVYRPKTEMYIPIQRAKEFHTAHPDFFAPGAGTFKGNSSKLALNKEQTEFELVFEPSGERIRSYITEDNGKAIESVKKQSILGDWVLRGIFQLKEYEPLTEEKMNEIGINGIRVYKIKDNDDVHLQFIWIEADDLPDDYVGY